MRTIAQPTMQANMQPNMQPQLIFHICTRAAAQAAQASGSYSAASLHSEGFIHCSQAHQVAGVAQAFYAGQPDLVLLCIDFALLRPALRFEAAASAASPETPAFERGQQFPHLYGQLNMDAVVEVVDLIAFGAFNGAG